MNILKKIYLIFFIFSSLFLFSCSKDLHYSGVSENSLNKISENYLTKNYTKEEIAEIIGSPLIKEDAGNLWIYQLRKDKGNETFKKNIYNKTLKLKFENNILRSVEEVNSN